MGSNTYYAEESPLTERNVSAFSISSAPVTNGDYARFVSETGYVTVAERPLDPKAYPGVHPDDLVPGSLVFVRTQGPVDLANPGHWWRFVAGACWQHPEGPDSSITARLDHPVVQVAYEDAEAYAAWADQSLPTEAQWEWACRAGEPGEFIWGDHERPEEMANIWQGRFPFENTSRFQGTSPIGSYPANAWALSDMIGNVWEWTADWWQDVRTEGGSDPGCCGPDGSYDPLQPDIMIPRKVLKGGSHLCAASYCLRYRPAARIPQMVDSATSHIGFRCVANPGAAA